MGLHKNLGPGEIHVPYEWTYDNASQREGASGFVSGDLGKLARQLDDSSLWILTATTPTWVAVGGIVAHDLGGSDHNADTLANLNSKISDATLDDQDDGRLPLEFSETSDNGVSSTTSTTYQQKLRLTTPDLPAGDYKVLWYAELASANNNAANYCEARVELNDTTEVGHSVWNYTPYEDFAGMVNGSGISGVQTIDIDYRTSDGTVTAYIRRARIAIWRVG